MSEARPELQAGAVGRPHGLDGSFYVTRPVPRLLVLGASVRVATRSAEIVRRSGTDQRPIVRLAGIDDRAGAEELRGQTLNVAASAAPALAEGEWWAHELEGCRVFAGGQLLGTVARMIELPSCEALEVSRGPGEGSTLIVPMVRDAIHEIDAAARRVQVDADFLGLELGDGD